MGKQEEINKYGARECKRQWPSDSMLWTAQFSYMWVWKIGGKEKVHASWVSRHQEINEKMKGGTFMPETEPSLMFSFGILGEIRSEKDSTNWLGYLL